MILIERGRYKARLANKPGDVVSAQRFRHEAFHGQEGIDADRLDDLCQHVLVEDESGTLVCVFRFMHLENGAEIGKSYSAQFYDLSALKDFDGSMVELGRFCTLEGVTDPTILRTAWAALTRYVDDHKIGMLFGCSSFTGTDAEPYGEAFALLAEKHLAPSRWLPRIKAPKVFEYASRLVQSDEPNRRAGLRLMPPLLRSYLAMGGWVSDHAVIDPDMDTLHVFTGVEIGRMPASRQRTFRSAAANG